MDTVWVGVAYMIASGHRTKGEAVEVNVASTATEERHRLPRGPIWPACGLAPLVDAIALRMVEVILIRKESEFRGDRP